MTPECPHCNSADNNRERIDARTWLCRCCGKVFVVVEQDVTGREIAGP